MSAALIPLTEAIVDRGARAWACLKSSAAEQRQLWREVGDALNYGRALHKADRAFKAWCDAEGFGDIHRNDRAAAMWLASNWTEVQHRDAPTDLSHPRRIQERHREAKAAEAEPDELKKVEPKHTAQLDEDSARRVVKTMHRAQSGDEGADIAQRQLEALARKHGMSVEALVEAAKNGAPGEFFRFTPHVASQVDELRGLIRGFMVRMGANALSADAQKAVLINLANTL